MPSLCVFCGSAMGRRQIYRDTAAALGEAIARQGLRLVYGGASVGLMETVAAACLAAGGQVVGVITSQLMQLEVGKPEVGDLRIVDTMAERKAIMFAEADAFLILPGGVGTMDELFEALAFTRLDLHDKPCGILNVDGYYDPLLELVAGMHREGFSPLPASGYFIVDNHPGTLLERLLPKQPQD